MVQTPDYIFKNKNQNKKQEMVQTPDYIFKNGIKKWSMQEGKQGEQMVQGRKVWGLACGWHALAAHLTKAKCIH